MAKLKTMTVKVAQDGEEKDLTVAVVGPGGHPVYEIDGKEVEQDIVELRNILSARNDENAKARVKNKELQERLDAYGELDPEMARQAMDTVANLDDKKLLDAKQVDVMKQQWEESFKANKDASDKVYQAKIEELQSALDGERGNIKKMLVERVFTDSKYLENTIFDKLRDNASLMFGKHFVVENDDNGGYRVKAKAADGTDILSVARPGQLATHDEAIEHLINIHPQKDYILRGSQASGSGAQGGAGGGAKGTLQQLQAAYDDAVKRGDTTASIGLKNRIHEIQTAGKTGAA